MLRQLTKQEWDAQTEEFKTGYRIRWEREQAQNDTRIFFERTSSYKILRWQKYLGARLNKLKYQTGQRLLIHKPPQHGGSIFLSQRFIPWMIGNFPNIRTRLLTYNITRSTGYGSTILRIMQDESYKKIFPSVIIPDRTAAAKWYTSVRQSYNDSQESFLALGLETGFIGSGGDLIVIDDPYANDKDPFSDTVNNALWKTHNETIVPRMNPETNVIVMYHSWNPDDYGSRLKDQGIWEHLIFSAINENMGIELCERELGEALAPELMPLEALLNLRDSSSGIGRAAFESLYQGDPKRREGSLFKIEWFSYKSDFQRDENGWFVGAFDWASSSEPTAGRTSFSLWYKHPSGRYTKVFAAFGRFNPSDTHSFIFNCCKYARETYENVARLSFVIEQGIGAGDVYVKSIQSHCAEFSIRSRPPNKDKTTRALPLIAQMEIGNVEILDDSNFPRQQREGFSFCERWNKECEMELLQFSPNCKHDDLVDSDTLAFNELTTKKRAGVV